MIVGPFVLRKTKAARRVTVQTQVVQPVAQSKVVQVNPAAPVGVGMGVILRGTATGFAISGFIGAAAGLLNHSFGMTMGSMFLIVLAVLYFGLSEMLD